ncbi:hypothetical protein SNEBB_000749 [Seison nebaliae]|nr:hypothetical protein SNEBB_000749 [Seison nebaliae]
MCSQNNYLKQPGKMFIRTEKLAKNGEYFAYNFTRWRLMEQFYSFKPKCFFANITGVKTKKKKYTEIEEIEYTLSGFELSPPVLVTHDVMTIVCKERLLGGQIIFIESYFTFYSTRINKLIREKQKLLSKEKMPYNWIILGIDSLSSQHMQRVLRQSFGYLMSKESLFFRNSAVNGPNTFPNFLALLTGMLSENIQNISSNGYIEYRSKIEATTPLDDFPFLWKYLPKYYVTYMQEDYYGVGMFYYLRRGFKKSPIDIDFRSFYKTYEYVTYPCNLAEEFYDYINRFQERMKEADLPFFQISHFKKYSHNNSKLISLIDKYLLKQLERIINNYSNNSIILLFGDHGARLDYYSRTNNGMNERTKSSIVLHLPDSLKRSFSKSEQIILKNNLDKMITPADIHFTFLDIMGRDLKENLTEKRKFIGNFHIKQNSPSFGGRNLLRENISYSRTCTEAGIPMISCMCFNRKLKIIKRLTKNFNGMLDPLEKFKILMWHNFTNRYLNRYYSLYGCLHNQIKFTKSFLQEVYYAPNNNGSNLKRIDIIYSRFPGIAKQSYFRLTFVIEEWVFHKTQFKLSDPTFNDISSNYEIKEVDYKSSDYSRFLRSKMMGHVVRLDRYSKTDNCLPRNASRIMRRLCVCP